MDFGASDIEVTEIIDSAFDACDGITTTNEFVSLDIDSGDDGNAGKIGQQAAMQASSASLIAREEHLKQKEAALQQLEQQLKAKYGGGDSVESTDNTNKAGDHDHETVEKSANSNNWPHAKYASYLYHDIQAEIPESMQALVRTAYKTWKLTSAGYLVNLIAIAFAAFHDQYYDSGLMKSQNVFTALLWVIVAIPLSFLLWYMNLYRISQKYSAKNWLVFTVAFGIHTLFSMIVLSGCPWYPVAGIFFVITCFFSKYTVSTIFGIANCCIWFLVVILSMRLFKTVREVFGNGINAAKQVKAESETSVARMIALAM